jgi:hypothetical protein
MVHMVLGESVIRVEIQHSKMPDCSIEHWCECAMAADNERSLGFGNYLLRGLRFADGFSIPS